MVSRTTHSCPRRHTRVLLVLASSILAIAACELFLREQAGVRYDTFTQSDADMGWALRPGFSGWAPSDVPHRMTINAAGMRDYERSIASGPRTLRVAVLGDSYVQGFNVAPTQTFPAQLDRRLNGCIGPTGARAEVLNFGVSGYGTAQELLAYRHRVMQFHPQIVVLGIHTRNDIFNNHPLLNPASNPEQSPYFRLEHGRLVEDVSFRDELDDDQPWWRDARIFVTDHSRVAALFYERVWASFRPPLPDSRLRARQLDIENYEMQIYAPPRVPEVAEAWAITEAILLELQQEAAHNGSELWVVSFANPAQDHPDVKYREAEVPAARYSLFYPNQRIAAFATNHGILNMSLAEPMAAYAAEHQEYLHEGEGMGHWNERGYALAADLVGSGLCRDSVTVRATGGMRAAQ